MPIFDQGYQHWQGTLSGQAGRWLAITRQGVRTQLKNRWVRWVILAAWGPALLLSSFLIVWGLFEQKSSLLTPYLMFFQNLPEELRAGPRGYRTTFWTLAFRQFFDIQLFFSMILVLLVGPDLISQDLRFNAMPLYLSRPVRRFEYFLGKLGVIAVYLSVVTILPVLLAFVLGFGFSLDPTVIRDTARILVASLAYGAIVVVSAGTLMLAFSSLSRNSRYVGAMWLGFWLVGNLGSGVLTQIVRADWCPLVSYTSNLHRIRDALLDAETSWDQVTNLFQAGRQQLGGGGFRGPFGGRRGFLPRPPRAARSGHSGQPGSNSQLARAVQVVAGPAHLSLALVGRRAGGPRCTLGRHPHNPGPLSRSAEMSKSPRWITDPRTEIDMSESVIEFHSVSKWYGHVIGVNNLSLRLPAGVTGLLGPNGSGKSTLLQLATGQLRPSQGEVRVLGHRPWNNPGLNRLVGLCPEQDAFFEWMTGREFLTNCALLGGLGRRRVREAAERTLELVGMTEHADRPVRGYSKGMRQRIKLAQALVHDPLVLFLDEPLTGTDPVARRELMDLIIDWGRQGRTVLVSSHIFHEVQAVTREIVLLNRGRLVALGDVRQIRDLIDSHPHRIVLRSPTPGRWPPSWCAATTSWASS